MAGLGFEAADDVPEGLPLGEGKVMELGTGPVFYRRVDRYDRMEWLDAV